MCLPKPEVSADNFYTLSLHYIITEQLFHVFLCQVSLQPRLTDEELYELSLAREPRIHSHSVRKIVMQCLFHFIFESYNNNILVFTPDKMPLRCEAMAKKVYDPPHLLK